MTSGITQNQNVIFRGLAEMDNFNGRLYVGEVKEKWMYPLYPMTIYDSAK